MTQGFLTGHGSMSWQSAVAIAHGTTAAWADLDGFHVGPLPADIVGATHAWAWDAQRRFAIRIDVDRAVVAELNLVEREPSTATPVEFSRSTQIGWPQDHGRVAAAVAQLAGGGIDVIEVAGPIPLQFFALHNQV